MFNFLHPRPAVDGRAVAVHIVQQKASSQQDERMLIVAVENDDPGRSLQQEAVSTARTSSTVGQPAAIPRP